MRIDLKKFHLKKLYLAAQEPLVKLFHIEKFQIQIPNLINKIKYTQNKFIWMKAGLGIMTTDTKPKLAMESVYHWK